MHLQPAYRECRTVGGAVASDLYRTGLRLPSGSTLGPDLQRRVIDRFCEVAGTPSRGTS